MDWVTCPICKEPDMQCETDKSGVGTYIHCVNLACPSNVVGYEKPSESYTLDACAVALWNAEIGDTQTVEGFRDFPKIVREKYYKMARAVLSTAAHPTLVKTVRSYSNTIKNHRTPMSTWRHLRGEIDELAEEIQVRQFDGLPNIGGTEDHDGIVGEAMDVINCALDIIFQVDPNFSEEKMVEIQHRKCQKWKAKYAQD